MHDRGDRRTPRGDRRSAVACVRFPERRTGFDRRATYPLLGSLRDEPRLLLAVLLAFVALSISDGVFTYYELVNGLAVEGNPVLAALIEINPALAAVAKTALTLGVALAVWAGRRYRRILAAGVFGLAVYVAVIAYHLGWLGFLAFA